jgi:hypothetical protein
MWKQVFNRKKLYYLQILVVEEEEEVEEVEEEVAAVKVEAKEVDHGLEAEMSTVEEEEDILSTNVIIVIVNNILKETFNCTGRKEENYGAITVIQEDTMMVCVLTAYQL